MAKKAFNLAELISEGKVSGLDTATDFEVKNIPLEKIISNEANFYELSNLQPLADSIALDGLQQPLVVMPADEEGNYKLLSGHRRRAAIELLVNDAGATMSLSMVPCIVRDYKNEAMAELQLILANSTARVLTPSEVSKQAERVTALLYQLKESGVEFPGRMRDHVAEACNVSASKLARLKVIREKLVPEALKAFDAGKIAESAAYALAQTPAESQEKVLETFSSTDSLIEWKLTKRLKYLDNINSIKCDNGSPCKNRDRMLAESCKNVNVYNWLDCSQNGKCCKNCSRLYDCKSACTAFENQIKKHKSELKEEKLAQKNKEETKKLDAIAHLSKYWLREGMARERAGITYIQVNELLVSKGCYGFPRETDMRRYEMGDCDDGYYCRNYLDLSTEILALIADLYGCSIDYLMCRTDDPVPWVSAWRSVADGQLPAEGDYVFAICSPLGAPIPSVYWNDKFMDCTDRSVANVAIPKVTDWMPMPASPDGKGYSGAQALKKIMEGRK